MTGQKHIAIVGGGIIGLCAAYYLQKSGCAVTVIEKGEVGSGSSLHNAGLVSPSHFIPLAAPGMVRTGLKWMLNPESPFYIKPRLDAELLSWLWRFAGACTAGRVRQAMPLLRDMSLLSLALFDDLARLEGMEFAYTRNGLLMLFRTEHAQKGSTATAAQAATIGIEARVLSAAELHDLEPDVSFSATGGVFYPHDAHLTPAMFIESLRDYLSRLNVRFMTSTTVLGFSTHMSAITAARTSRGSVAADEFVLAGGAWSPGILRQLQVRLPVQAGKGYSITVRNGEVHPRIPCILEEARVAVTPMGDRIRFAGTMELAGVDTTITMRRVDAILRAVPRYIGGLAPLHVEHAEVWGGLRPCTPDGLPFIGRFRRYENLIAATGHAMIGVTLAPVTGKLVAEIVEGRVPSVDTWLLRPDRYA